MTVGGIYCTKMHTLKKTRAGQTVRDKDSALKKGVKSKSREIPLGR